MEVLKELVAVEEPIWRQKVEEAMASYREELAEWGESAVFSSQLRSAAR